MEATMSTSLHVDEIERQQPIMVVVLKVVVCQKSTGRLTLSNGTVTRSMNCELKTKCIP